MTGTQMYVQLAEQAELDNVRPGWVALLIVAAMGVALALLMWSMVRQFRKISFDERPSADAAAQEEPRDGSPEHDHESNGSPQA